MDDLAGAGITAKERLQNIESVLVRIDQKLDGKADAAVVAALEVRVREIETGNNLTQRRAFEEVHAIREASEKQLAEVSNGVSALQKKFAYYAGGVAVAVFLAEAFINLHQLHFG
jgi:hypothetical protein